MVKELDIEDWKRKAQFEFFKDFELPFFNITSDLEVSKLVQFCNTEGLSFFKTSLFLALKVANQIEAFRYRIQGEKVLIFDRINVNTTVLKSNKTFFFCALKYVETYKQFSEATSKAILDQEKNEGLTPNPEDVDVIHFSVIPWVHFRSFQHARRIGFDDTGPKIVFSKC